MDFLHPRWDVEGGDEQLVQADRDDQLDDGQQVGLDDLEQIDHGGIASPSPVQECGDQPDRLGDGPHERGGHRHRQPGDGHDHELPGVLQR